LIPLCFVGQRGYLASREKCDSDDAGCDRRVAAVIGALTTDPLKAVEQAIKARDARQFKTAYAGLTTACNACHLSQDHAPVVIRVPSTNPYPDQDFRTEAAAGAPHAAPARD
jgi:hypothetical protein